MKVRKFKFIIIISFLLLLVFICSSLIVFDVYGADFYTFKNEEQVDVSKYPNIRERYPEVTQEMIDNGHLYHICLESYSYGARWRYVTVLSKYPIGLYVSGENLVFGASASINPNDQYMYAVQDVYLDNSSLTDALPGFSNSALGFYAQYSIIDKNGCFMSYSDMPISNNLTNLRLYLDSNGENTNGLLVQPSVPIVEVESSNNHLYLRGVNAQFITPTYSENVSNDVLLAVSYQLDNWQQLHINDYSLHYVIGNSRTPNIPIEHTSKLLDSGLTIDYVSGDPIQAISTNQKFFNYYIARPTWNDNGNRLDQAVITLDVWLEDNNGNKSGHFKKQWSNNSDYDGSILANDLMVNNNPFIDTETDDLPSTYNPSGNQIVIQNNVPSGSGTITIINNEPLFVYDFEGVGNYTGTEVRKQLKDMFGLLSVNGNKGYIQSLLELINATGVFGQLLGFGVATTVSISIIRIILRR